MATRELTTSRRALLGGMAVVAATPALAQLRGGSGAERALWDTALADYRNKRAFADSLPIGTPNEDDFVDTYCEAMDRLIEEVPAPDLDAVIVKFELVSERYQGFEIPESFSRLVIEDLRRISRAGRL